MSIQCHPARPWQACIHEAGTKAPLPPSLLERVSPCHGSKRCAHLDAFSCFIQQGIVFMAITKTTQAPKHPPNQPNPNQPPTRPTSQPASQPTNQLTNQPTNLPTYQPTNLPPTNQARTHTHTYTLSLSLSFCGDGTGCMLDGR